MDRKQRPGGPLELFVVYDHPRDYPGHFVVRRFDGAKPTEDFALADTLEGARREVPSGLHRVDRSDYDDRCIVEVWL